MPSLLVLQREFEKKGQKPVIPQGKEKLKVEKGVRILLRRRV